ncbi:unnamed protein product [Brachionus calyciflorus]|uniref:Endonuclease/exonuclease/phosphatase domain-containing protein n=1 Tax=Brachionus calyciflorus TaxID=104777 RepID=A0A814SJH4_9BILA|nr:unnamed protein product [Brachionus calyciflorus]
MGFIDMVYTKIKRNTTGTHHVSPAHSPITKLSCLYFNATSLVNKMSEFKTTLCTLDPEIVVVSETWFKEDSLMEVENYTLYKKVRNSGNGGGVAIYIKNSIKSIEIASLRTQLGEQVWCSIIVGKEKILIGCQYRSTNTDRLVSNHLTRLITTAKNLVDSKKFTDLLVFGDYYFPQIKWSST